MKYLPFLLRALMFAPDTGGGSGGGSASNDDTGSDADPDTGDDDAGDDTDDDDDDDVDSLKAKLAAQRAETEKHKALSRKHEARAKANRTAARERDELRRKGLDEPEAALEQARQEAKAEAAREFGTKAVRSELRGELKGRMADEQRDALIESVDLAKFLDDDHDVDTDKVAEWVERVAPKKSDKDNKKTPDLGQGRRGGGVKPSVGAGAAAYAERHGKKTSTT